MPVPPSTLQKCLLTNLFDRSGRTRTVTSSRRCGLSNPFEQDLQHCRREKFTSPNSATKTSVRVSRREVESAFIHIVSAEVLPPSPSTDTAESKSDIDSNVVATSGTKASYVLGTLRDRSGKEVSRVGSTVSVKNEGRARTFSRTIQHKRSRARSPGNRRTLEDGIGLESRIGSSALKIGKSRTPWIQRESPSPQPGKRKRTWRCKVISTLERDRRAAARVEKNRVAEHIAAELRKDTED